MTVRLIGKGVGVGAAAHLLRREGFACAVQPTSRRPVPVIMLSDPALGLLRDVFASPALLADKARIERRVVRWGAGDPVAMPHGAIVVSEDDLAAALGPLGGDPAAAASFTIHAAPPFPASEMRRFGARRSAAARVRLSKIAEPATCWIESTAHGWLFLIPDGTGGAWLLGVGGDMDDLVAQSRLVAPLLAARGPASAAFETAPRMLTSLAGPDWLACGTSAIAFDPICGDGTAQATREAILAAAVLTAERDGSDGAALRTHYHSMLLASMRRHLQLSLPFYANGGDSAWWREQFLALREGYDWCTARLGQMPEPRFALRDFALVSRELAA